MQYYQSKPFDQTTAFDVRDYDQVQQFINDVDHDFGKVDVLFMNAGSPPQWLPTRESDPQVWWDTVAISLQGAFNFSRDVIPIMRREEGGRIVFTSSAAAHGSHGMSRYAIGKLGMVRLAETLHNENKEHAMPIKAFAIHPGAICTRFFTDVRDAAEGKISDGSYVSETLPGRTGRRKQLCVSSRALNGTRRSCRLAW
jgi:NAD(P)-dependent dehydrogenase (short-subunit alcohol dehydrogenase family)